MRKSERARRKRRTRQHVIADLAINHVERSVLRCGYTVERFVHDYGVDLLLFTYDSNGYYENGSVRLQVKASDKIETVAHGQMVSLRVEQAHLRHWLREAMPVILVVYDAARDRAHWVYVQRQLLSRQELLGRATTATVAVRIL